MASGAKTRRPRSFLTECFRWYLKGLFIAVFEFSLSITVSEIIANGPAQFILCPVWPLMTSFDLEDIDPSS